MFTRRRFILSASATLILPKALIAADMFATKGGDVTVHPVDHASIVLETPAGVIYVDPVGDPSAYSSFPLADLILITHEHGDHYNVDTLAALKSENTILITNPAVFDMLPEDLKTNSRSIGNGDMDKFGEMSIQAIPAYNITEERGKFHPEGRDNGYVLDISGFRIYISGDTEDTPEMRALQDIDLCFLCMNLPFTMDKEAAASAVAEFKPKAVYPYHYRGRDGDIQDPQEFAELVGDTAEVKLAEWY